MIALRLDGIEKTAEMIIPARDIDIQMEAVQQLKLIQYRMTQPHIRSEVRTAWRKVVDNVGRYQVDTFPLAVHGLCALPGCDNMMFPESICSRCKTTRYCSGKCQKAYVDCSI